MSAECFYSDFEGCVAHFKANPPEGGTVELEFSEEEIQRIRDHALHYDCTLDAFFLAAVMACFITELKRRDRRTSDDTWFESER